MIVCLCQMVWSLSISLHAHAISRSCYNTLVGNKPVPGLADECETDGYLQLLITLTSQMPTSGSSADIVIHGLKNVSSLFTSRLHVRGHDWVSCVVAIVSAMDNLTPVTLVVKAPNQKIGDQTVECALDWTVKQLKQHLASVYPSKPVSCIITAIYHVVVVLGPYVSCAENERSLSNVLGTLLSGCR